MFFTLLCNFSVVFPYMYKKELLENREITFVKYQLIANATKKWRHV